MSSRKKDKKEKKNNQIHSYEYTYLDPEEEEKEERIAASTEAATHLLTGGHYLFGKKRTSRKKKADKQRRRRRSRTRSFGTFNTNEHLKSFLVIVLFVLLRSALKKEPRSNSINHDLNVLENNAISVLTITSILELIEKLVGKENRDKILLAYTLYSIGNSVVDLV